MKFRFRHILIIVTSLAFVGAAATSWIYRTELSLAYERSLARMDTTGPVTIILTGDSMIVRPIAPSERAGLMTEVAPIISESTAAITNLEGTFLRRSQNSNSSDANAWPPGNVEGARELERIGFNMSSCANNHVMDFGPAGLKDTLAIAKNLGLHPAGCGEDLDAARSAIYLGDRPRRIALISVTTSSDADTRATARRGDILGRPGVSPLKYVVQVSVDRSTFQVLQHSPHAELATPSQITLSGQKIDVGDKTAIEFRTDETDAHEIIAAIRMARSNSDIIVVALHSHEPSNESQSPAAFARDFAHKAIDAGAQIVVGHGPHQLRGIERYKHGVIFYSLGDFIYQHAAAANSISDVFDAGIDLYQLALSRTIGASALKQQPLNDRVWSESAMAIVRFNGPTLQSIRVIPLDLGTNLPVEDRGIPRIAGQTVADHILDRLSRLSKVFGAEISSGGYVGIAPAGG